MTDSAKCILRPASLADSRQLAALFGEATSPQAISDWMKGNAPGSSWQVAEDLSGAIRGFQSIEPGTSADICEIATFLADGASLAIGSRLFEASSASARQHGYAWIEATFAQENEAARIYYQSHGFRVENQTADRITMRFDLD